MASTFLLRHYQNYFENHPICIAYSGGIDSHVLLHCIATLHKENSHIRCRATYIDHDLHPHSHKWAKHCEKICHALEIPFSSHKIIINIKPGESLEEKAREKRYAALFQQLKHNEILLTAHTLSDQAETFVLQALRGAGIKGLAAMPSEKQWGQNLLLRPFLQITRDEIVFYAKQHRLHWIEDSSNQTINFDRNYVRHKIFPLLKKRWSGYEKTLARASQHCANAQNLLDDLAHIDLQIVKTKEKNILSIIGLKNLTPARCYNVLRYWFTSFHLKSPSEKQLGSLVQMFFTSANDRNPFFAWDHARLYRFKNKLYLLTRPIPAKVKNFTWDLAEERILENGLGILTVQKILGKGFTSHLNPEKITVKFREGGEVCRLKDRGSKTLKHLFQEWEIPPWERAYIPLIYYDNTLVSIVNHAVCAEFLAKKDELGYVVTWQHS